MNIVYNLIDSVDMVKGWIVSVSGAILGTALNSSEVATVVSNPEWFCQIAPILQTFAWSVAIIAGVVTIWKGIRNKKKK